MDDKETKAVREQIEDRLKKENLSDDVYAIRLKEEMKKSSVVKQKMVKLDPYQEIALANIDALKEELVNMIRKKRDSGKDSFELIPEKANKLHDDRAYTFVMASFYLSNQRMSRIRNKAPQSSANIINQIQMTKAKQLDKKFG
jgi:hypothetical protein